MVFCFAVELDKNILKKPFKSHNENCDFFY